MISISITWVTSLTACAQHFSFFVIERDKVRTVKAINRANKESNLIPQLLVKIEVSTDTDAP